MVRQLNNYSVEVELLKDGKVHVIPRINFSFTISGLTVARKQLPLRVAYAGTLHKAQGKTLDKVLLVLTHDCFAHGQLYVGCTRVAGAKHIAVFLPAPAADTGEDHTRNADKSKRTSPVPPPTVINVVSRALVADADGSSAGAHASAASVLPRVRGQRFPADPDAHAEASAWDAPVPLNLPDGDSDTDDADGSSLGSSVGPCRPTLLGSDADSAPDPRDGGADSDTDSSSTVSSDSWGCPPSILPQIQSMGRAHRWVAGDGDCCYRATLVGLSAHGKNVFGGTGNDAVARLRVATWARILVEHGRRRNLADTQRAAKRRCAPCRNAGLGNCPHLPLDSSGVPLGRLPQMIDSWSDRTRERHGELQGKMGDFLLYRDNVLAADAAYCKWADGVALTAVATIAAAAGCRMRILSTVPGGHRTISPWGNPVPGTAPLIVLVHDHENHYTVAV
eukprot:gene57278-biopygen27966